MFLRIAALLALAVSVLFLQRAVDPILEQNRKVREWRPVEASVTARFVDRSARGGVASATRPAAGQAPAKHLEVEYRHAVDGTVYKTLHPNAHADEWAPAGGTPVSEGQAS